MVYLLFIKDIVSLQNMENILEINDILHHDPTVIQREINLLNILNETSLLMEDLGIQIFEGKVYYWNKIIDENYNINDYCNYNLLKAIEIFTKILKNSKIFLCDCNNVDHHTGNVYWVDNGYLWAVQDTIDLFFVMDYKYWKKIMNVGFSWEDTQLILMILFKRQLKNKEYSTEVLTQMPILSTTQHLYGSNYHILPSVEWVFSFNKEKLVN